MSNKDDDKGGFVVGGISFGVTPSQPTRNPQSSPSAAAQSGVAGQPAIASLGDHLLPLRVVVVADLNPREEHNAGINPPSLATPVEAAEIDALFRKLGPKVALQVESVLLEGRLTQVDVALTSMKSFRPDSLVREVPLLHALLEGRMVLERLRDGTESLDSARVALSNLWKSSPLIARVLGGVTSAATAPTPAAALQAAPAAAADDAVADLLDMVDLGESATAVSPAPKQSKPQAKSGKFDTFLNAVAATGSTTSAQPAEAIKIVERALSQQLGAILQHPEFRRLEEAWRGLWLLLQRAPRSGSTVEVVSASAGDAASTLERVLASDQNLKPPVSFAIVDDVIEDNAAAYARLRALGDVAEANMVPVISNASASLLGRELKDIDGLDNKKALFEAPERAPWRAEAKRPSLLWVALGANRVLSRLAYSPRMARVAGAAVQELPKDDAQAAVWMQPCWAIGALALRGFAKTGWPCALIGAKTTGLLEDLMVRELVSEDGTRFAIPTEAFFSTETQRALGRLGVMGLAAQPNSDACYLLSSATAYVPPPKLDYREGDDNQQVRLPQTPLVDQLFVARVAQFLERLGSRIGAQEPPEAVRQLLEAALWELMSGAAPSTVQISVEVVDSGERPVAQVTIRPGRFLGVQLEEFALGVPLG